MTESFREMNPLINDHRRTCTMIINRSAENQNHCSVQNGKPEKGAVVYFEETRP